MNFLYSQCKEKNLFSHSIVQCITRVCFYLLGFIVGINGPEALLLAELVILLFRGVLCLWSPWLMRGCGMLKPHAGDQIFFVFDSILCHHGSTTWIVSTDGVSSSMIHLLAFGFFMGSGVCGWWWFKGRQFSWFCMWTKSLLVLIFWSNWWTGSFCSAFSFFVKEVSKKAH